MDLSSVLKSLLFVCLHWSETGCLVLGSCGESSRDCFHKVFKIGTKLSGYFAGIWMYVLSSWIWLLNFEGITFGPEERCIETTSISTTMQLSCSEVILEKMPILFVPKTVERFLNYWYVISRCYSDIGNQEKNLPPASQHFFLWCTVTGKKFKNLNSAE